MTTPEPANTFAPTRWSLIVRARGGAPAAKVALGELCATYWQPVFRYLLATGRDEDTARELTQEFFARVLERGADTSSFVGADPRRGRFRSYLLGAVKHFLADQRDHELRQKRGGGITPESLDEARPSTWEGADSAAGLQVADPNAALVDPIFDRHWALALMAQTLATIEQEFAAADRATQYSVLKPWLVGESDQLSQTAAAAQLGLSESAVKVAIHRLRKRFREMIRREIAQTLPDPALVEEELRYLVEVLVRG